MVSRATIHEGAQTGKSARWRRSRRRRVKRIFWKSVLVLIPLTLFAIIVYIVLSIQS